MLDFFADVVVLPTIPAMTSAYRLATVLFPKTCKPCSARKKRSKPTRCKPVNPCTLLTQSKKLAPFAECQPLVDCLPSCWRWRASPSLPLSEQLPSYPHPREHRRTLLSSVDRFQTPRKHIASSGRCLLRSTHGCSSQWPH